MERKIFIACTQDSPIDFLNSAKMSFINYRNNQTSVL